MEILEFIRQPWPWYIAGPLVGLTVPALILGNKSFGISGTLTRLRNVYVCKDFFYLRLEKRNMEYVFCIGILIGGIVAFSFIKPRSNYY
jgi:hypothetical protein